MNELNSMSSILMADIERYFKEKKVAKKSGKDSLKLYVEQNQMQMAEMIDKLKIKINAMLLQIEKYEINLDDIYVFRNQSINILRREQSLLKGNKEEIKIINNKIEDLKSWYSNELKQVKQEMANVEDAVIEYKSVLAKVEKRRLFDLRPSHLAIAIVISFFLSLIAGLLINFLYLMPLKDTQINTISIVIIVLFVLIDIAFWTQLVVRHSFGRLYLNDDRPAWKGALAGFIASFLDTIGIGSFAMATAIFKVTKAIKPYELKTLPGTLNVGVSISLVLVSILFIGAIEVDVWTLILFCVTTIIGTLAGSFIVEKLHRKLVTFIIAASLFATVVTMILVLTNVFESGDKTGLTSKEDLHLLFIGMFLFFGLGVLMSFGVGLYAPAMIVITLLGLDPITSIPIMTCSAALSTQIAAVKYTIGKSYVPKISFHMSLSGIFGVLAAFIIVFVLIIGNNEDAQNVLIFFMRCISAGIILLTATSLLLNYFHIKKNMGLVKVDKNELLSQSSFQEKFKYFITIGK